MDSLMQVGSQVFVLSLSPLFVNFIFFHGSFFICFPCFITSSSSSLFFISLPSFLPLSLSFLLGFSCVLLSALITSLLPYHPYLLILFLVLVSIPLVCFFISSLCFFLIFPFPHFRHFILIYILLNIFVSLFPLFRNV